jgi:hypothetical protein
MDKTELTTAPLRSANPGEWTSTQQEFRDDV